MDDETPRFALPLLAAGQAQKEVLHNEAVTLLEALAQPIVEAIGAELPPAEPAAGDSWIVGGAASGEWSGHAGDLASWTAGSWRFLAPIEGMAVYDKSTGCVARYQGSAWVEGKPTIEELYVGGARVISGRQPAISSAAGGTTVDTEARAAVEQILAALRAHGLIAT